MGKLRIERSRTGLLNKIGVFSASLLVSAAAVYLYSPVILSHADDSISSIITFGITPTASMSFDASVIDFDFLPSSEGTFQSKQIVATVTTNSLAGYELYFSAEDNNTNMTHVNPDITDVIASNFSGTVTSATMENNKWGYSLDDVNFRKIPTLNSQLKLKDIDHYPDSSESTATVYIGTKVTAGIKSGVYEKNVLFSAIVHDMPMTSTMQDFDKTSLVNVGDEVVLEDERDGNIYTVKKLADGNVWMTDSLKLQNKVLTSEDSDLPSGVTWTVPASSITKFDDNDLDAIYIDPIRGGYYTFYEATAGWGSDSVTTGSSTKSICPKGWKMPTGGPSSEYATLYSSYNTAALLKGAPNLKYNGYVDGDQITDLNSAYYWSASVKDVDDVYIMHFNDQHSNAYEYYGKHSGMQIRCMAR